ncbi:MAG TPA: hypothetical protein DEH22_06845, partial [Chloroflexi bacterium]|nr:hypothetical protein [Chloroflexota bacterium]
MKKIVLIILTLVLLLGSLPLQNASAATTITKYDFSVKNNVNDTVVITLTSEELNDDGDNIIYTVRVLRFDEITKELPKGDYGYEYTVCNATYIGKLKLKDDVAWELLPCGIAPTKMRFNSHLADKVTVTMYGPLEMPEPEEQEFTVELGGNRIADILSG